MKANHQQPAWLQQALDELVAEGAPGALAELRDEHGTWRAASGVAELGTERPVDPAGWFRIGSVTKTFTATVVLQLVAEGRVGLDDTVQRWLPDVVPGAAAITIRQLLNHTSGLYNYTRDLTPYGILRDRFRRWTPHEVILPARRKAPDFPPGTARAYNNTAFVLLGMLIEKVTNSPYGDQIARRMLRPLDLRRTRDDVERLPEPHAHGYLAVAGEPVDVSVYNSSQAGSAGGMISTAADLNRFFAELLTGNLLGVPERREMLEGGLGLTRYGVPGVMGKDGGFHGYRTWSFHSTDASWQLTVSMTFGLTGGPATEEFLARVVRLSAGRACAR
ncbi:serine hydrolase domain-containing protein [Actinoplanes solisilvae]|uniref:serine hydrolase domain-containing protein n=1 Tax=Actinoplanes solisilvae TaxID=2486853 RepID=UPI0013E34FE9|nr:serine hydrolase domain-containing protein [Actinoplanes solisilvae]